MSDADAHKHFIKLDSDEMEDKNSLHSKDSIESFIEYMANSFTKIHNFIKNEFKRRELISKSKYRMARKTKKKVKKC